MFLNNTGENCLERHLDPSIYERIKKTQLLMQKGINPEEYRSRGGLDLETYNALQQRWQDQDQRMGELKQQVRSDYGSLKAAPKSIGPCKPVEPVTGTKTPLVLLTEFQDKKSSVKPEFFKDLLFTKGSNRSLRDYYLEASWNQLDINGDVNDEWFTATNDRSEYVDTQMVNEHYPNAQKLVEEAVLQAKSSNNFDFSRFAKDGRIEILIVVYAGSGMDTKLNVKYIRPHQDNLAEPIEVQDGIWADRYCLIPELPADDVGAFCHEMGHLLGLPDLYKEGYSPVVGSWCLMAIGDHNNNGKTPAHLSAWCKVHLGWAEPQVLKHQPQPFQISAVIDDKHIYKLEVADSGGKEYFLLENRQQKGFDKYLPGSGLVIWHVDEAVCVVRQPNHDPHHFFITLKESDGREDLQRDMMVLLKEEGKEKAQKDLTGDVGDAFPGISVNRLFDDESKPNSRSYKGTRSLVKVSSISDSEDLMKAEMGIQFQSNGAQMSYSMGGPSETPNQGNVQMNQKDALEQQMKLQFMNFIMSSSEVKEPYDDGFEAGKLDSLECIKSYKDGYRAGYYDGYDKALKKASKKFKESDDKD